MTIITARQEPLVHVRFQGQSWRVDYPTLGITPLATDAEVRAALARQLDVPLTQLDQYVIERHDQGNITVRPEAVFG